MERELGVNETALEGAADDLNSAGKQADKFGDEIKQSADQADDAVGVLTSSVLVVRASGRARRGHGGVIGTAAVAAGKALVDMTVNTATPSG